MTSLEREKQLCDALARLTADRGYAPTLRELAPVLGVSLTRIAQLMERVQRKGLVTSAPGICRSWRVVRAAEQLKAMPAVAMVVLADPPPARRRRRGRRVGNRS